jgi:hypothetical protein
MTTTGTTAGRARRRRGETAPPAWAEAAAARSARIIQTFEMVPHWYQDKILARLVESETGCLLWTGPSNPSGYGTVSLPGRASAMVHRVAFLHQHGEIGFGLTIDHLCGEKLCANVEHLEAVTQRANTMRAGTTTGTINAAKTECHRGHDLTDPANLVPSTYGWRQCRTCKNINQRNQRRTNA